VIGQYVCKILTVAMVLYYITKLLTVELAYKNAIVIIIIINTNWFTVSDTVY